VAGGSEVQAGFI